MATRQRFRLAALALATLVFATACESLPGGGGASAPAAAGRVESRLSSILERGTLRVGLSGNQAPLNMRSKSGEFIGFEVDVITALVHSMNLELELVARPFGELLDALEAGDVDLVISGMTITPERNARVAFAGPYFISGKSVLTRQDKIANVDSTTQLDSPERTYAALAGSTSEAFVQRFLPTAKLVSTEDYDTAVQLVIDDQVDAMVADYPICGLSVLRHPDAGLSALMTPFTTEPLGIALPPDDPLFVNLVQNYLTTLDNTGILVQLKAKWFTNGAWLSELP